MHLRPHAFLKFFDRHAIVPAGEAHIMLLHETGGSATSASYDRTVSMPRPKRAREGTRA